MDNRIAAHLEHIRWTIEEARRFGDDARYHAGLGNVRAARDNAYYAAREGNFALALIGKKYDQQGERS